jgi:bacterioferritin-associated ferredoxin
MYVCICNAIRECELREAARKVPGDADAVYAALGKTPQCGQCLDDAAMILIEEREKLKSGALVPTS